MPGSRSVMPEAADDGSLVGRPSSSASAGVAVSAAGRLHLGFLDPSATAGRRFGSIGMMIEDAETVVHLAPADGQRIQASPQARHEVDRATRIVARLQQASGRHDPIHVHVSKALPAHVGLGSGTQLALALGRGFSELHGLGLSTDAIAGLLGRGLRSGIGLTGFEHGGVLVDGGHRAGRETGPDGGGPDAGGVEAATGVAQAARGIAQTPRGVAQAAWGDARAAQGIDRGVADSSRGAAEATREVADTARGNDVPPLLARFDFPPDWRVIVVQDLTRSGLHGDGERLGLQRLPTFGRDKAAHLCHLVLMQILPALAERDFPPFARGISELQELVGNYFAPVQGGVFSSPAVGRLMAWISDHHLAAVGQSSWGPTAFAILPSEDQAERVVSAARAAGVYDDQVTVKIVAGRNRGALVERLTEPVLAMR